MAPGERGVSENAYEEMIAAEEGEEEEEERGEEKEENAREEEEGRAPVSRRGPAAPSKQEMEEHMATQIPFRDWCFHCMAGRGRNDPHRSGRDDRKEDQAPTVAMDYGFLKSKSKDEEGAEEAPAEGSAEVVGGKCGPMLVIKDAKEDNMFATVVPAKGPARPWIAKRCTQ